MTTKNEIEQLFRSNYKQMFILANRMLHDEDAARDIVHEVLISNTTFSSTKVVKFHYSYKVR